MTGERRWLEPRSSRSEIDRLLDDLIWTHPGTTTYYRNRHGQIRSPMPYRLVDSWSMTGAASLDNFRLTSRTGQA